MTETSSDQSSEYPAVPPAEQGKPGGERLSRLILIALVLAMAAIFWSNSQPTPLPPGWHENIDQAVDAARTSGRPLLVAFHSHSCPPCRAMERDVLGHTSVQAGLCSFVPVRIDAFKEYEVAARYGVSATPTYLILDSTGQPRAAIAGYVPPKDFVEFMRSGADAAAGASLAPPEKD
jgi:thioredoxin-related protein